MLRLTSPTFSTQAKKPGISRGHPQKSSLQGGCGGLNDLASCGDPRSRLNGEVEVELCRHAADPVRHRGTVDVDLLPRIDIALPIERQPVGVFRDHDMGEQTGTRPAAL